MSEVKEMNDPDLKVGDTVRMQYPPKYNYGWISVNDRLPESGKWVLIKLNKNPHLMPMDVSYHLTQPEYPWFGNYHIRNYSKDMVTHWMPLPSSPEVNNE